MTFLAWWRHFCRTTIDAVKGTAFYRRPEAQRPGAAGAHLFVLLLILWVLPVMVAFFIGARETLVGLRAALRARVPAGTIFELKDGRFTNTLAAPLVFSGNGVDVIVNTATTTLGLGARPGLAVGADGIVAQDDASGTTTVAFSDLRGFNFSVQSDRLDDALTRRAPFWVFIASLFLLVFATIGISLSYGALALFHAGVLWLAAKLLKKPWSFPRALATALYAACAAVLVRAVTTIFGAADVTLSLLAYWILLGAILYDHARGTWAAVPTEPAPQPPNPGANDERS